MPLLNLRSVRAKMLAWRAAVVTQSALAHEYRVRGRDGSYRWFAAQ